MSSAYLLLSHGSRDPRPEIAMQQLAGLIRQKLQNSNQQEHLLDLAYLELSPEPLHKQIQKFAEDAVTAGCHGLKVIPLFLLPGVHVMKDIPDEIALAQQALGQDPIVNLQPYIGSHPNLEHLISKQISTKNTAAWILLAHGSRRPGSEQPVEAMAENVLFPGGITDAIAQSIETLKLQFPLVNFYLAPPLGASTAELAELIWDLIDT